MNKYRVNEVFFSIQGEGIRAGTAAVFVRFAGCNLKCTKESAGFDCDTDYVCKVILPTESLWNRIREAWGDRPGQKWVIFTGGEPAIQLDNELLDAGRDHWKYAIETNGTIHLACFSMLDWVTVSPKSNAVLDVSQCDEYKVVLEADGVIPIVPIPAQHCLLSPAFNGQEPDPAAIARCVELVKQDPRWRLSLQIHKLIGVR